MRSRCADTRVLSHLSCHSSTGVPIERPTGGKWAGPEILQLRARPEGRFCSLWKQPRESRSRLGRELVPRFAATVYVLACGRVRLFASVQARVWESGVSRRASQRPHPNIRTPSPACASEYSTLPRKAPRAEILLPPDSQRSPTVLGPLASAQSILQKRESL